MRRRGVVILGSTGSIGTQALDVISAHPDLFVVLGLGAGGSNISLLAEQAVSHDVPALAVASNAGRLREELGARASKIHIGEGHAAMVDLASQWASYGRATLEENEILADDVVVLNGITGSVGLAPTLAALKSGALLALANKESLVVGGGLIREAMTRPGQIVPVDSEHSAIAQALRSGVHHRGLTSKLQDGASEVERIILTASGGPFRGKTRGELAEVRPDQALNHPTWNMGPVVTINSSTLMNKGLELIEAAYLFDVAPEAIVPVVHPQSVIHSMVEFRDGSTIAQASPPDMRLPIALGLSWPERLEAPSMANRWDKPVSWTFEPLDSTTFPAVDLARQAAHASELHPAVMNAANEECVAAFIAGDLKYLEIVDTVAEVLAQFTAPSSIDLDTVLETEKWARQSAHSLMKRR